MKPVKCDIAGTTVNCPPHPAELLEIMYGRSWRESDHEYVNGMWRRKVSYEIQGSGTDEAETRLPMQARGAM